MAKMTNKTFVAKAKEIQANYKTVYLWGGWGQQITTSVLNGKYNQYPSWYTTEKKNILNPLVSKDYWGFDCVGLIKAIAWGWYGNNSTNGGASYGTNNCPDTTANGMIEKCSSVSTNFTNMVPGEAVWTDGHIGIYIGDGYCIEATPGLGGYTPGVKISALANVGKAASGTIKQRTWKKHGFLPFLLYTDINDRAINVSSNANTNYSDASTNTTASTALSTGTTVSNTSSLYTYTYDEYETIANLGTQPFNSFIDLWIGDTKVSKIPPNYMMSCDVTTYTNGVDSTDLASLSGNVVLFDKYCDEVEYLINVNGGKNCKLRFGDSLGRQSTLFNIILESYSITLKSSGNILTLSFIAAGGADEASVLSISAGSSPSDAVKIIANKVGWKIGRIDDAVQLTGAGGESVTFNLLNDNPKEYIMYKVAPRAVRASDGKGGYQFYLDSSTTPPTVNFHPLDLTEKGLRTYVYQKGKNSPILDFTMSATIHPAAESSVVTEYKAAGVDPLTKESFSLSIPYSDTVLSTSGTNKTVLDDGTRQASVNTSGLSKSEVEAAVSYRFTSDSSLGSKGTLTIIGDPSIGVTDCIRMIFLNNDNTMHHMSGIYLVLGVNHHISRGTMTTTLSIEKTGSISDASVTLKSAKVSK